MQSFHLEMLAEMAWLRISESLGSLSGLQYKGECLVMVWIVYLSSDPIS